MISFTSGNCPSLIFTALVDLIANDPLKKYIIKLNKKAKINEETKSNPNEAAVNSTTKVNMVNRAVVLIKFIFLF